MILIFVTLAYLWGGGEGARASRKMHLLKIVIFDME